MQTDNVPDCRSDGEAEREALAAADGEAVTRYRDAAAAGCPDSQALLGLCYLLGLGVERDLVSAQMWLEIAAALGCAEAVEARELAAQQLTDSQLEAAQRLALAWLEERQLWFEMPTEGSC